MLERIIESTRRRILKKKEQVPLDAVIRTAMEITEHEIRENKTFKARNGETAFEKALKKEEINFICEVKKASPSKGIIAEDFQPVHTAVEYEKAGAACISVLTEPEFFLGKDDYLKEIKEAVSLPILQKDFVVDEYQLYQAKALGACCVLLICSLFEEKKLKEYIKLCGLLRLSALVEAHDEEEARMAVNAGAKIIGVNNRDLKTFKVDISNSLKIRQFVPKEILFVAESGIKTVNDIDMLRQAEVNGVLIGETLMKSADKGEALRKLGCGRI